MHDALRHALLYACRRRAGLRCARRRPAAGRCRDQGFPVSHRRGSARTEIALLHGRRADRRSGAGAARIERFRPDHAGQELRRRAVRSGPGARHEQIFHHRPGRHRRGQIVEAVERPAHEVPEIHLRGPGRRAASPAHRAPRRAAREADHRPVDGRHAGLDVGRDVSRFHGACWCRWDRSLLRCRAATGCCAG